MKHDNTETNKSNPIIDDVDVTGDTLTSRAGLSLFVRYVSGIAYILTWKGCLGRFGEAVRDKILRRFTSNCSAFSWMAQVGI